MPDRTYQFTVADVRKYRGSGKRGPLTNLILDNSLIQFSWSDAGATGERWVAREDQLTYIEEGVMGFNVGGETFEAGPGMVVYLPAGIEKQAWSVTDTKKVEVFGHRWVERWEFAEHQLEHEMRPPSDR